MFTNSCFIRRNTSYLVNQLKELGYDVSEISSENTCIATSYINAKAIGIYNRMFDTTDPHSTWNCAGRIDCGKNESLFLAIAALRDDTDKNQIFILDEDTNTNKKGTFILNIRKKWYSSGNNKYNALGHKASVEELIKHFNK